MLDALDQAALIVRRARVPVCAERVQAVRIDAVITACAVLVVAVRTEIVEVRAKGFDKLSPNGDGLRPSGDELGPSGDGLSPNGDELGPSGDGLGLNGF